MTYNKIKYLILYIIQSCQKDWKGLTLPKLYKILYFIDFGHFALFKQPITDLEYLKFKHGPVPRGLRDYLTLLEDEELIEQKTVITDNGEQIVYISHIINNLENYPFSLEEKSTIARTINRCKDLTANELSDETHYHYSWISTQNGELITFDKAQFCDFEALGYYYEIDNEEYNQTQKMRKHFIEDKELSSLLAEIQTL